MLRKMMYDKQAQTVSSSGTPWVAAEKRHLKSSMA
jgi:hypothetical protein